MDEKEQADRMAAAVALYMISTRGSKDREGIATRKSKRERAKREDTGDVEHVKVKKGGAEDSVSPRGRGRRGVGRASSSSNNSPNLRKGGTGSVRARRGRGAGSSRRGNGRSKIKSFADDSNSSDQDMSSASKTKTERLHASDDSEEEKLYTEVKGMGHDNKPPKSAREKSFKSKRSVPKVETPSLITKTMKLESESQTFGFTGASLTPEHITATPDPTQALSQNIPSLGLVSGIQQASIASTHIGSTSPGSAAFSTGSSESFLPSSNSDVVNLPSLPTNIHSLQLPSIPLPNLVNLAEVRTSQADDFQDTYSEKSQKVLPLKKRKVHKQATESKDTLDGSDNDFDDQESYVASPSRESNPEPMRATYRVQAPPFLTMQTLMEIKTALTPDEDGDLPLHIAVVHENMRMVNKLINLMRIAVKGVDKFNKQQQTPLHLAVKLNFISAVDLLIKSGASINTVDCTGSSAIHMAVQGRFNECLKLMLNSGTQAELNMRNFEGLTPLHISVNNGDLDQVTTLLKHGGDIDMADGKSGRTALFHAAESNQKDMVAMLLKHGANPEFPNYAGITTTMAAQGRSLHGILKLIGSVAQEKSENKWSSFAQQADQDELSDKATVSNKQAGQQSPTVLKQPTLFHNLKESRPGNTGSSSNNTKFYRNVFLVSDTDKNKQPNIPSSCISQSEPNSPTQEVKKEVDSHDGLVDSSNELRSLPLLSGLKKEIPDEPETVNPTFDRKNVVIVKTLDGKLIPLTQDKNGRFVAGFNPDSEFSHRDQKLKAGPKSERSSPMSIPTMSHVPLLLDGSLNPSQTSVQARQFQKLLQVCRNKPPSESFNSAATLKPQSLPHSLPPSASSSPLSSLTLPTTGSRLNPDLPPSSPVLAKSRTLFRSTSLNNSAQLEEKLPHLISTLSMRHGLTSQKGVYEDQPDDYHLIPRSSMQRKMSADKMYPMRGGRSNSLEQDNNLPLNLSGKQAVREPKDSSSKEYRQDVKAESNRRESPNPHVATMSFPRNERIQYDGQAHQVRSTGNSPRSSHSPFSNNSQVMGLVASDMIRSHSVEWEEQKSQPISNYLSHQNTLCMQSSNSHPLLVISTNADESNKAALNALKVSSSGHSVATVSSNVSSLPIVMPLASLHSGKGNETLMNSLRGKVSNFVALKHGLELGISESTDPIFLHGNRVIDLSQTDDPHDLSTASKNLLTSKHTSQKRNFTGEGKPASTGNFVNDGKIVGFSGAIISIPSSSSVKNSPSKQQAEKKPEKTLDVTVPRENVKRKGKRAPKVAAPSPGEASINKINKETDQKLKKFLGLKRNEVPSDGFLSEGFTSSQEAPKTQERNSRNKIEAEAEVSVVETVGIFSGSIQQVKVDKGYSTATTFSSKSSTAPTKHSLSVSTISHSPRNLLSPQLAPLTPNATQDSKQFEEENDRLALSSDRAETDQEENLDISHSDMKFNFQHSGIKMSLSTQQQMKPIDMSAPTESVLPSTEPGVSVNDRRVKLRPLANAVEHRNVSVTSANDTSEDMQKMDSMSYLMRSEGETDEKLHRSIPGSAIGRHGGCLNEASRYNTTDTAQTVFYVSKYSPKLSVPEGHVSSCDLDSRSSTDKVLYSKNSKSLKTEVKKSRDSEIEDEGSLVIAEDVHMDKC